MTQRKRMGEDFWRHHSDSWGASGLTQADYCTKHGLSLKTLARWRTKFAADTAARTSPFTAGGRRGRLVPVVVREGPPETPRAMDQSVSIRADGQPWVISVGPGADARALKAALSVLLPAFA
jgi:hypothetical protein